MSKEEKTRETKEGGNDFQRDENGNDHEDLEEFLAKVVEVDLPTVEKYRTQLLKVGIKDYQRLQEQASINFLTSVCKIKKEHAKRIMQLLFSDVGRAINSHFKSFQKGSYLIRENIIILKGIGHGAVGRDYIALFAPCLKLVVIKCIETKNHIQQQVIMKQLSSTYSVSFASCCELYMDEGRQFANAALAARSECPYLIHFFGAFVDVESDSVCLTLEYMNAGTIKTMIDEGKIFTLDEAAILAFSVLQALSTLHSR